jgi:hypothetical protein
MDWNAKNCSGLFWNFENGIGKDRKKRLRDLRK